MVRVVVTATAIADVAEIVTELHRKAGGKVASKYRDNFDRVFFEKLPIHPEIYQARPKLGAHIRVGAVYPYLVIHRYDPRDSVVSIVRVLHGQRRITRKLIQPV
jgi:toxin ParE1/3/4